MIPTKNVTVQAYDQMGAPAAGAIVTARLVGTDIYNSQVVGRIVQQATCDVNGLAVLALFPNELGMKRTYYRFTVVDVRGVELVDCPAVVPNVDCNLAAIANNLSLRLPVLKDISPSLTSLAGLASAPDKLPYFSGVNTFALADFSAFGRAFIAAPSGAAAGALLTVPGPEQRSVKLHGAVGDGVTNDKAAILAAIAEAGNSIYFPEGTYYVGTLGATAAYKVFDLTSKGAGFSIHTQGKVIIKGSTGANVEQSYFFYLAITRTSIQTRLSSRTT
jgi:hypothetical protein